MADKFEYIYKSYGKREFNEISGLDRLTSELNKLGEDGWEPINFEYFYAKYINGGPYATLLLKRKKPDTSEIDKTNKLCQ